MAGFQTLLNAVRATGNTNVVLIGGLAYSNDLTQWLQYKPTDPTGNLAAFAHIYNFNTCSNTSCFDSQLAPVAAQVPLTLSEIGENDCSHGFIDTLMNWGDSHNVGYLGWTCWRDGGTCPGITYQVAGFQTLLNAVRATGNTNVVLIGGLAYYQPTDSQHNLAAFAHIYNFNTCANTSCWDSQIATTAQTVPVTLTEIGENDCAHGFVDGLMNWADAHGIGYLGWTWNTWDCSSGPSLISDFNGTATNYGQGLKTRLATVSN